MPLIFGSQLNVAIFVGIKNSIMKKIMLSVLVLWATGAVCQEIKMPDDKRKEYVKERPVNSIDAQTQQREEAARKRQIEAQQRRETGARSTMKQSGKSIYCMIRETSSADNKKSAVEIVTHSIYSQNAKEMMEGNRENAKALLLPTTEEDYKTGLDAVNNFSNHGWSMNQSHVYTIKESVVREYLMELQIQ